MNKNFEDKLTMSKAVNTMLRNNLTIVATIPALSTKHTELGVRIANIEAKDQEQKEALQGKAQDKYDAEDVLVKATMKVAGPLSSYGADNGLNDVAEAANVSSSNLRRLRDTELPTRCKMVKDMANTHIADLADYGVTAGMLTAIDNAIVTFNGALGQREAAVDARAGATNSLKVQMRDLILHLETMDGLVEVLKDTETQFYAEYHFARVIRDLGQIKHVRSGVIAAAQTMNLATTGFDVNTSFLLKNPGLYDLKYNLGANATDGTGGVIIPAGTQQIKSALQLGTPGNSYLNVTNLDATNAGQYDVEW